MAHDFFDVMFSSHHWTSPFTCPCSQSVNINKHSLSTSQKVFAVAMAVLTGVPTFGVGGVLTFYTLCAAFKSRNVVWVNYVHAHPGTRANVLFFHPSYWGLRFPVYRGSSFSGISVNPGRFRPSNVPARGRGVGLGNHAAVHSSRPARGSAGVSSRVNNLFGGGRVAHSPVSGGNVSVGTRRR